MSAILDRNKDKNSKFKEVVWTDKAKKDKTILHFRLRLCIAMAGDNIQKLYEDGVLENEYGVDICFKAEDLLEEGWLKEVDKTSSTYSSMVKVIEEYKESK